MRNSAKTLTSISHSEMNADQIRILQNNTAQIRNPQTLVILLRNPLSKSHQIRTQVRNPQMFLDKIHKRFWTKSAIRIKKLVKSALRQYSSSPLSLFYHQLECHFRKTIIWMVHTIACTIIVLVVLRGIQV